MSKQSQNPFKWRHFQYDIILLHFPWYLRYSLSYRDLEEMMVGRGLHIVHMRIYHWVQVLRTKIREEMPNPSLHHKRLMARC